jgi:hypothetical protein
VPVKKAGDWDLARRVLTGMPERLERAVDQALRQEAQLLRSEVVKGITSQAPGGRPFEPLAPNTLASRRLKRFRGTKALLRNADLRNAIQPIVRNGQMFVGVPRKAKGRDGASLVDVARLNEFGSDPIVIPITPKMRRFLHALRKEAGGSGGASSSSGVPGVIVTRIRARPFLRPAVEQYRRGGRTRFLKRVARLMNL